MFRITLEPVTFTQTCSVGIIDGAQITTDLLLRKICTDQLNYTEEICANFTSNENLKNEIQINANNFEMIGGWMQRGFALFYSLFAGSLADDFGYKPMILLPLFGLLFSDIAMLINYIFLHNLPVEFFYMDGAWAVLGGNPVYLLGK